MFKKEADFYQSKAWKRLREKALKRYGHKCMKCGSKNDIQVDHVLPRSIYASLALSISNLGILCSTCNKAKSDRIEEDYRPVYWIAYYSAVRILKMITAGLLAISTAVFHREIIIFIAPYVESLYLFIEVLVSESADTLSTHKSNQSTAE